MVVVVPVVVKVHLDGEDILHLQVMVEVPVVVLKNLLIMKMLVVVVVEMVVVRLLQVMVVHRKLMELVLVVAQGLASKKTGYGEVKNRKQDLFLEVEVAVVVVKLKSLLMKILMQNLRELVVDQVLAPL